MTNESGSGEATLGDARLLDRGAQADIYEWGEGRVLRLLFGGSEADVTREAEAMRGAAASGVPVPTVHEVVAIDGRPGLVMDRVDGPPMLNAMLSAPWRMFGLARRFGAMQAAMHGQKAPAATVSNGEVLARRLHQLEPDDEWLKQWAEAELEALPGGQALLHGDFHPGNVLLGSDGPSVIDWAGATSGPAEADVALTLVLVEAATPPNANFLSRALINLVRTRVFMPRYLAGYRIGRAPEMTTVNRWRMVQAIARIADGPANEQRALRRMIRESGGPRDFGPA